MLRSRKARRAAITLLLLTTAIVVWMLPTARTETGKFVLVPKNRVEIRAYVAGFVTDIHHGESDRVSVGTLIAQMEIPELNSEIAQKLSQISEARARIRTLGGELPPSATAAQPVKGKKHEIKAELEYAQQKLKQSQILNKSKVISDNRLSEIRKEHEVWENKYEQILSEQEVQNARLARLIEELAYLHELKSKLALRSPIEGIITTQQVQTIKGRYFEEGDLIFDVVDPSNLEVEVTLSEDTISSVGLGQRVILKPFSLPYQTFECRVVRIAPVIQQPISEGQGPINPGISGELKVYCDLEQTVEDLTPGMSGYARIYLSEDNFGNVIVHQIMRFVRTEFWW